MIYLEYIKNAFRSQFRYRLNWGMQLFGNFVSVYFQICLWTALMKSRENVITMDYMLGYILASAMLQSLISRSIVGIVNGKINSGQIAMDFIKPIRFRIYVFCESLGNCLFSFLFTYLPITIMITILYKCHEFWLNVDLCFLVSVCLGIYLNFSITYCLGLTSFWGTQTWILGRFFDDVIKVFSGKMIPVWMLPVFLLNINVWLPFQYIFYSPISMLLNQLALKDKIEILQVQVVWCLLFTVLGEFMERKGKQKLQVQGG